MLNNINSLNDEYLGELHKGILLCNDLYFSSLVCNRLTTRLLLYTIWLDILIHIGYFHNICTQIRLDVYYIESLCLYYSSNNYCVFEFKFQTKQKKILVIHNCSNNNISRQPAHFGHTSATKAIENDPNRNSG